MTEHHKTEQSCSCHIFIIELYLQRPFIGCIKQGSFCKTEQSCCSHIFISAFYLQRPLISFVKQDAFFKTNKAAFQIS
jgi:hypothetical protein